MELKCAVVFTFSSLLSVTATPHGYGAKGGAVARAEAGAVAGAFGVVGLPLSIQSGPGFSGSFSKSSSSSFASSGASSSSSSFSFSGSGANGFGLNSLGTTGPGGCSGGCHSDSKGINNSNGTGSDGYGLQIINGVKSNAAAGASAGSYINLKDGTHTTCSNGICPGKKPQCEGPNCKDANETCTSGQCEPKSSSESSLSDKDHSDSASEDSLPCKNNNCIGNNKKPSISYDNGCASGQCSPPQTTGNFGTNVKCTSGECANLPSEKPGSDNGSNNTPVIVASSSSSLHDSAKTSTTPSQASGVDCKNGNCDSLPPNSKPSYGYSSSIPYNQNQPQTTVPSGGVAPIKPATYLTVPKEEEPCTHPTCKPPHSTQLEGSKATSFNLSQGKINCEGGHCNYGQSHTYPLPTNDYSNKGDSQTIKPSYAQGSSDQKGNNAYPSTNCASGNCDNPSNTAPLLPKIPEYSQTYSPSAPDNCVTGNCGSRLSYHSGPDIQVSKIPTQAQGQGYYSPICPSGNCNSFPKQPISISSIQPTIPNYPHKPTQNENCPLGNCVFNSFPSQSNIPNFSQGHSPSRPSNCASGYCGTFPSHQNDFDIQVSKVPTQTHVTDFSSNPSYPHYGNTVGTKNPVLSQQPSFTSPSNCALGNCQPAVPSYSQGSFIGPSHCQSGACGSYPSSHNLDPSYPRLPSYPQNILPNKPLNCVSGNCGIYPSAETNPSLSSIGPTFPPLEQPSVSLSPPCASGTCGNYPTYQQGGFGSSGYQTPSYSGAVPATNCASGNCAINPSTSGVKIPPQSIGSTPGTSYTSSTGLLSSGASIPTGPVLSSPGNCASGKCPNYPTAQPTSHQAQPTSSNSSDKLPDYVALGAAGGALNTGTFVPSSISSNHPSGSDSHATSNSGSVTGIHPTSSIPSHYNDKEQVYTGGFGGPPGILKPYEFTAPSHQLPPDNKKDQGHQCPTGNCHAQSVEDNSSNKSDLHSGARPCTSGKCEIPPDKVQYGQSNVASGAFAAAAAGGEGVVYTGGFGGPPGILQPYDGGKNGNIATVTGANHHSGASLGISNDSVSGNKVNGGYGAFSGATATANAGIFGSGSNGDHNKAGGCNSGCGSSEHGSYGGNFGLTGSLSKSDLLEKLHNGLNASGAGASSFSVGGSYAGSSASSHSVAGSSTKGGYGR